MAEMKWKYMWRNKNNCILIINIIDNLCGVIKNCNIIINIIEMVLSLKPDSRRLSKIFQVFQYGPHLKPSI